MAISESRLTENATPVSIRSSLVPEEFDLGLPGGRGGGKTRALCDLIIIHVAKYGPDARVWYLRQTHDALEEFGTDLEAVLRSLPEMWDKRDPQNPRPLWKWNKHRNVFNFANGARVMLIQAKNAEQFALKTQGRSATMLVADELTLWTPEELKTVEAARAALRSKRVPCRFVWAANPGGPSHMIVMNRWLAKWDHTARPFDDDGRPMVLIDSNYRENQHITDKEAYREQIRKAARGNQSLFEQWDSGVWTSFAGAYFAGSLSEVHNKIDDFPIMDLSSFKTWLAYDHGTRRPYVCYLLVEFPDSMRIGEHTFHRGDIVAVDERTSATRDALDDGGGANIPEIAFEIISMCDDWNVRPRGYGDDAMFSDVGLGVLSDGFAEFGVRFHPARKGQRVPGWIKLRDLFKAAEEKDGDRALYVAARCWYFWQSVPFLTSDESGEDIAKTTTDHAADALRYGIVGRENTSSEQFVSATATTPRAALAEAAHRANIHNGLKASEINRRMRERGIKTLDLTGGLTGIIFGRSTHDH